MCFSNTFGSDSLHSYLAAKVEWKGKKILKIFICLNLILGSFFKWVDKPTCPSCGSLTFPVGVVPPTPEEMSWGAGKVESYKCQYCGKVTRFPRYNHPAKLLGKTEYEGDLFNSL